MLASIMLALLCLLSNLPLTHTVVILRFCCRVSYPQGLKCTVRDARIACGVTCEGSPVRASCLHSIAVRDLCLAPRFLCFGVLAPISAVRSHEVSVLWPAF